MGRYSTAEIDRRMYITGSHTFSNEPNFFKNEKVVREKGSQWESLRMKDDVASMENEN